jgi:hypothetical protein
MKSQRLKKEEEEVVALRSKIIKLKKNVEEKETSTSVTNN